MASIGSDADRSEASLERAIQANRLPILAAGFRLDAAREAETEARRKLRAIEDRIRADSATLYLWGQAVYFNGQRVERGTLSMGNEVLRFSGWHCTWSVPLRDIGKISVGATHLPPRAGMPILGRLFPGQPRRVNVLLLTIRAADIDGDQLIEVANLSNVDEWVAEIHFRQGVLGQVESHRDDLVMQRQQAEQEWQEAQANLEKARSPYIV